MTVHNLFVSLPSVRGVHPQTVWNLLNIRTALEKKGHYLHGGSVYRMPLDLARNEMATAFLSTTCDMNLLLDDDVQLPMTEAVPAMMAALDAGCDIVSAPCRMRSEGNLFNIVPLGLPTEMGGLRVVECAWTGLGAVLVSRRVMEKLHADAVAADSRPNPLSRGRQTYRSTVMPDRLSAAIFQSSVEPAKQFFLEAPEDLNLYLLDDRVFSLKCHAAGFKIHAAVDVPTLHDGMAGCFSEEQEKLDRSRARAEKKVSLLGPDGKLAR